MTKTARLTLLTALTLSACQSPSPSAAPPDGDTGPTFRIYSVLQGAELAGGRLQLSDSATGETIFAAQPAILDESCLSDVEANENLAGPGAVLSFELTTDCAKTFAIYTAQNIGAQVAIVVNGELRTAPVIQAAITGGTGYAEGFDSLAEAEAIAASFE